MKKDESKITIGFWIVCIFVIIMGVLAGISQLHAKPTLFPFQGIIKDSINVTNNNQYTVVQETTRDITINYNNNVYYYKVDNTGTLGVWENGTMTWVYFLTWRRYRINQKFSYVKLRVLK